jgi:hypothetical protein
MLWKTAFRDDFQAEEQFFLRSCYQQRSSARLAARRHVAHSARLPDTGASLTVKRNAWLPSVAAAVTHPFP